MALWSTKEEKMTFYRKMDITEYLVVLDNISNYKLDETIQWRLLKIPFDVSNEKIMSAFLLYVDELFIAKEEIISKPPIGLKTFMNLSYIIENKPLLFLL